MRRKCPDKTCAASSKLPVAAKRSASPPIIFKASARAVEGTRSSCAGTFIGIVATGDRERLRGVSDPIGDSERVVALADTLSAGFTSGVTRWFGTDDTA